MGTFETNIEAMDNIIGVMVKFIELQDAVVGDLKSKYGSIEWRDDSKYEELGEVINQITVTIKGSYAPLSECITKVQLLKSIMEEYMSQHFI